MLLVIILVLVILRSTNVNLFKQEAKTAIELATQGKNILSLENINALTSGFIIINLDSPESYKASQFKNSKNIPFNNLLEKENRGIFENIAGEIILYSDDISTSSKAWVVLNQLGYKNVYILQNKDSNEVLKYKFQPDTTARLE